MSFLKRMLNYLGNEKGRFSPTYLSPWQQRKESWEYRLAEAKKREYQQQQRSAIPEATAAMMETQRRAAEDRARALAEIRMAQQQSLTAMQPWQQQIQALQAAPETIGAPEEAGIYEAGRLPVEAQTQALLRGMQEQYYPGGYRTEAMGQVQMGGLGTLSELRRKTALERVLRRRQDLMGLMGQQAGYAGMAAGIYGQTGQALSQLYGQTISAVPTYAGYGTVPYTQPWTYSQDGQQIGPERQPIAPAPKPIYGGPIQMPYYGRR